MTFETVEVDLAGRAYDVRIGPGLLQDAGRQIAPLLKRPRVSVLTEERVAGHHRPALEAALGEAGISAGFMELPPGETTKSWRYLQDTVEWLLSQKLDRDDIIVAFGGGVIGDLAGFAAAIVKRGVGFVQIPTTLLAQVDSSVGGKTGINSPLGKNLVGAFHQPRLVLADTSLLNTLPERDFLAGYGEVVKYGLLGDAAFFDWLNSNGTALLAGDPAARTNAVRRSCEMKARIVERDETEQGERALLNLGHTFGHALEAATGYSDRLLHGEAVAVGCLLAFQASVTLGFCPQEVPGRIARHFLDMGMKTSLADIPGDLPDADCLLEMMGQDKKARDGQIAFVLARNIGETFVTSDADREVIRGVLADALAARSAC